MLPTRLWRCEPRRFVICSAVSGGVLVFGCLPGERATSLFLRFLVAPFRARFVAVYVSFCSPACFPLFASVLYCLRYFVAVNGGLCPFIFQGFLFHLS